MSDCNSADTCKLYHAKLAFVLGVSCRASYLCCDCRGLEKLSPKDAQDLFVLPSLLAFLHVVGWFDPLSLTHFTPIIR